MIEYVVGFLFIEGTEGLILIEKTKPDWQKGKLNGVGGKVEAGETPIVAMAREFKEETGVWIHPVHWTLFANLTNRVAEYSVSFLYAEASFADIGDDFRQTTEERPALYHYTRLDMLDVIPNLRWLIPLAITMKNKHEITKFFRVEEEGVNVTL